MYVHVRIFFQGRKITYNYRLGRRLWILLWCFTLSFGHFNSIICTSGKCDNLTFHANVCNLIQVTTRLYTLVFLAKVCNMIPLFPRNTMVGCQGLWRHNDVIRDELHVMAPHMLNQEKLQFWFYAALSLLRGRVEKTDPAPRTTHWPPPRGLPYGLLRGLPYGLPPRTTLNNQPNLVLIKGERDTSLPAPPARSKEPPFSFSLTSWTQSLFIFAPFVIGHQSNTVSKVFAIDIKIC